jgi:hypothetical protein
MSFLYVGYIKIFTNQFVRNFYPIYIYILNWVTSLADSRSTKAPKVSDTNNDLLIFDT